MGQTGRRLTNYQCYLAFYDFSAIQGKWIGRLGKLLGFSNVTHVAPIICLPAQELEITICTSTAKFHTHGELQRHGVKLIAKIDVGRHALDINEVCQLARDYTDNTAWDLVFHAFVGRWLGLTPPRQCVNFACRILGMPMAWHPATLYRRLT